MLVIKSGNLLEATENILCHQVNEKGIMGAGLALQIAKKYPHIEQFYKDFCQENKPNKLYGKTLFIPTTTKENQFIANCFTQIDFITQYDLLEKVFRKIKDAAKEHSWTVAMPYKMGCGISEGDWEMVEGLLIEIFDDIDITIYKYNGDKH